MENCDVLKKSVLFFCVDFSFVSGMFKQGEMKTTGLLIIRNGSIITMTALKNILMILKRSQNDT